MPDAADRIILGGGEPVGRLLVDASEREVVELVHHPQRAGSHPWGIAYDPINAEIWVANSNTSTAVRFPAGIALSPAPELNGPLGVIYGSVEGTGYIWMINQGNGALTQINTKKRTSVTSEPVCTLKGSGIACLARWETSIRSTELSGCVWVANRRSLRSRFFTISCWPYNGACKVPTMPDGMSRKPTLNPVVPSGVFTRAPKTRP